jgi:predicted amidohydrolase
VRVALVSDPDWRAAVPAARERGADVICLPHLSFAPYVAATRDRAGLEHAERAPSATFAEALALAGGAWLAASA